MKIVFKSQLKNEKQMTKASVGEAAGVGVGGGGCRGLREQK